jgi:hypothetical protein
MNSFRFLLAAPVLALTPYLDQPAPGSIPVVFAPGIVSTTLSAHSHPSFSPSLLDAYWSAYQGGFASQKIWFSRRERDGWTAPQVAPFSGTDTDGTPVFAPDGKHLFFCSTRPLPGSTTPGEREVWSVRKRGKGWADPEPTGLALLFDTIHFQCSIAESGSFYLAAERAGSAGLADLWCVPVTDDGELEEPVNLGAVNGATHEITPYVAPDESYLLFASIGRPDSHGSADLYVSVPDGNGGWTEGRNLGDVVNTANLEAFAGISPDGRFLFFESDRDGPDHVYWVETRAVDVLWPLVRR